MNGFAIYTSTGKYRLLEHTVIRYTVPYSLSSESCFYPRYMGTASFTVNIMDDRIEGEGKCEENSEKEE